MRCNGRLAISESSEGWCALTKVSSTKVVHVLNDPTKFVIFLKWALAGGPFDCWLSKTNKHLNADYDTWQRA